MREEQMKTIADVKNYYGPKLAEAALKLGAIKLRVEQPFTWASGCRFIMTTASSLPFRSIES